MSDQESLEDVEAEIFDGITVETPETPEVEAAPTSETPAQPVEQPQGEQQVEPEAEPQPNNGMMPYGAYASEREKRKAAQEERDRLQKENEQAKARLAVFEKMQQQKPKEQPKTPDPLDDPSKFTEHINGQLSQAQQQMQLQMSEFISKQQFGEDVVSAAMQAAEAAFPNDVVLQARLRNATSPHAEAVKWHKEQQTLQEVGEDPNAYRERIIADYLASQGQTPQAAAPGQPAQVQSANPQPVIPPTNAARVSASAAPKQPSMDDIEAGLWGNR